MFPPHRIYVEPFAGGAAVYFRKGASAKEVLSDKDAEIAAAFKFLANMTPGQFLKLRRLPWVKSERRFRKLKATKPRYPLERFYRFYYLKKSSFGLGGETFNHSADGSIVGTDHLWKVHERLKKTRVHNLTALKMIDKYDSPNTFFYLDPPYPGRGFIGEHFGGYTYDDLEELISKLKGIKGKFLLSLGTEHQKYLPPSWRVKRLRLTRTIPSGDYSWGEHQFQFEIVSANYNLNNPTPQHYRHRTRGGHHRHRPRIFGHHRPKVRVIGHRRRKPRIIVRHQRRPRVIAHSQHRVNKSRALASYPFKGSKMPAEVAASIGSVSTGIGQDGNPKVKLRRL